VPDLPRTTHGAPNDARETAAAPGESALMDPTKPQLAFVGNACGFSRPALSALKTPRNNTSARYALTAAAEFRQLLTRWPARADFLRLVAGFDDSSAPRRNPAQCRRRGIPARHGQASLRRPASTHVVSRIASTATEGRSFMRWAARSQEPFSPSVFRGFVCLLRHTTSQDGRWDWDTCGALDRPSALRPTNPRKNETSSPAGHVWKNQRVPPSHRQ
jgi:hypothetical protein